MYVLYSIALFMALVLYYPWYFFKTRVLGGKKICLAKRLALGLRPRTSGKEALWIHAVSVGEVLSLQNLIRELKSRHPEWDLCFSTLTNTGLAVAGDKLKDFGPVFFIPLDFRSAVRRALRALRPKALVLVESELWPNLLREAKKEGIGVLVINGRMSQNSFKKYSELRPLARKVFSNVDLFLMQSDQDMEKMKNLEIPAERIQTAGNLKSEIHLPVFSKEELTALRRSLGMTEEQKVVVAGSTRKGEGEKLLKSFSAARRERSDLRLILAPRHIEKSGEIEKAALSMGFKTMRRTNLDSPREWDVLILDTIGELARFYALSDVAFVGGSLVDWGGHNILEPAYYGKPVFFGPHMQNFAFLAESFTSEGGARIVRTDEDLEAMFLMKNDEELRRMGSRAKEHLKSLGGATERTVQAIERFMSNESGKDEC